MAEEAVYKRIKQVDLSSMDAANIIKECLPEDFADARNTWEGQQPEIEVVIPVQQLMDLVAQYALNAVILFFPGACFSCGKFGHMQFVCQESLFKLPLSAVPTAGTRLDSPPSSSMRSKMGDSIGNMQANQGKNSVKSLATPQHAAKADTKGKAKLADSTDGWQTPKNAKPRVSPVSSNYIPALDGRVGGASTSASHDDKSLVEAWDRVVHSYKDALLGSTAASLSMSQNLQQGTHMESALLNTSRARSSRWMLLQKKLQRDVVGDIDILVVQEHKIAEPFGELMHAGSRTFWEPASCHLSRSCGDLYLWDRGCYPVSDITVHGRSIFFGLSIVIFSGLCFSLFSPAFNLATNDQWHTLKDGVPHLVVYTAFFYFSISCVILGIGLNLLFLYYPICGLPKSSLRAYMSDWNGRHWALLAGFLCGFGNGFQFMGGQAAGYAAADAVQALPLVSTMWAVILFGEYHRSSRKTYILLASMLFMFIVAVGVLMASSGHRKAEAQ
ncbi:hypothetical protein L7F22_053714 [Adiantum nelumboides]|nr:hypothetical protein [Adiantum nelumboides]